MISVGIDVSKEKSTVFILSSTGEIIKESYEIFHNSNDIHNLVKTIKDFRIFYTFTNELYRSNPYCDNNWYCYCRIYCNYIVYLLYLIDLLKYKQAIKLNIIKNQLISALIKILNENKASEVIILNI